MFKIYGNTDGVIIFLLLFLYGLSIITLSFVFTIFLNQEKHVFFGCIAIIILNASNYIHLHVDTSVGVKWLTALISPVALGLGLTEVCVLRALINLHNIFGVQKDAKLLFFLLWMFPYLLHSYFRVIETVRTKDLTLSNLVYNIQQV